MSRTRQWRISTLTLWGVAATVAIAVLGLAASTSHTLAERPRRAPPEQSERRQCRFRGEAEPHHGMVWIPGGTYEQGDDFYPEEQPIVRARVAGFWMDTHEVTNAEFAAFVKATGYVTQAERPVDPATHRGLPPDMLAPGAVVFFMPKHIGGTQDISQWWHYVPGASWRHPAGPGSSIAGRENYPVVEVTHADALQYARWRRRALPTEAEWEWAARGGNPKASRDHDQPAGANTWQGIFPVINSGADGFVGLAPSGCYPPNAYGLYDMIGNVWELTGDIYRPSHGGDPAPDQAPYQAAGRDDSVLRYTIKGGSFLCAPNYCARYRSGAREGQEADLAESHLGFRTVLRAPKSNEP
jgi:formylglycine-generating enzyme required for sulfatase activity